MRLPRTKNQELRSLHVENASRFGEELSRAEWFRKKDRYPAGFGFHPRQLMPARCEHDDGDFFRVWRRFEDGQRLEPVHFRHENIHDDQVGMFGFGHFYGFASVAGFEELEVTLAQAQFGQADHVGLVIYQQNSVSGGRHGLVSIMVWPGSLQT